MRTGVRARLSGFSAGEVLTVELVRKEKTRHFRFDRHRVRVNMPLPRGGLIGFRRGGMRIEIGQFPAEEQLRGAPSPGGQAKIIILGI